MKYIKPEVQLAEARVVNKAERQHHVKPVNAPLYVVTSITNPNRYYSRYRLYDAFEKMVNESGAILYTIELALRDRHFEVTTHDDPHDIQLRSHSTLWHKENLLNIAISRLPEDWEYVAWIDADVTFSRTDWATEAVHLLQHYKVVQMFSHVTDLGPDYEPLQTQNGFVYSWINHHRQPHRIGTDKAHVLPPQSHGDEHGHGKDHNHEVGHHWHYPYGEKLWHPGLAWCARRSAIADLGGLGEISILGSGDHNLACALIGRVQESIHGDMQQSFKDYWNEVQDRATRSIKRNIGFLKGTLLHNFHGSKKSRGYNDRWKILVEEKFDPLLDLKKDPQGVLTLTDRNTVLRDRIREYFGTRLDDDIRVD